MAANVWTRWLHFAKTAIEPTTINPPCLMRYHPQILGYQWDPGIGAQGSKDPLVTNQIGFWVILLVWLIYLKKQIWMFGKRVPELTKRCGRAPFAISGSSHCFSTHFQRFHGACLNCMSIGTIHWTIAVLLLLIPCLNMFPSQIADHWIIIYHEKDAEVLYVTKNC